MPLVEQTLFGESNKPAEAIERIKHFEGTALQLSPDGYYVAFSGGKDSIVVLDLVRRAGVAHKAHFHLTTVDPPELLSYIRVHYPDVTRERPRYSMYQLIKKNLMPPTRTARYCCRELKERGGSDSMVITGVRWAESIRRKGRRLVEQCNRVARKMYLHPIIEWSDDEVWEYIRSRQLPYCSLYDEGLKRIGCVGCPMSPRNMPEQFKRWPRFARMYKHAFTEIVKARQSSGKLDEWDSAHPTLSNQWRTAEGLWQWWLSGQQSQSEDAGLFE